MIPRLNEKAKTDLESNPEQAPFIEGEKSIRIERIAGVVETSEVERLRRLIFRSTKGKSFMHVEQYLHPEQVGVKSVVPKSVYIITFQDGSTIKEKITRICDSFTGQRYELPETADLTTHIERMKQTIENQRLVYENTKMQLRQQLLAFDRIEGNL